MAAVSHVVFALGYGGPPTKCLSRFKCRPQIASSSD